MADEGDTTPEDLQYPGGVDAYREALLLERAGYEQKGKADRVAEVDACLASLPGAKPAKGSTPDERAKTSTSRAAAESEKR